ncbi:DUF4837 family protein [Leptobacterium sp. I13]|uniref:DUF4837 family protein n=1 Tax=Leptobacterium meishanense TaxID=3128904 RepID=UPI0030EED04E
MKKSIIVFFAASFMISCMTTDGRKYIPDSVGAINTLAVVIDNDMWNGEVGDEIRKHFAAPVDGLPWDEPLFSIHQIPPSIFDGFARNSRNIVVVEKDITSEAKIVENPFAKPQKVAFFRGENEEELIHQLQAKAQSVINIFKKHELKENQQRIKRSLNKETILKEKLGITLTMPSVYKTVKQEKNFFWIERQIPKGTMNILVYEMPLYSIPNDSTQIETIIKMRDSIGKRYIPGPVEGSYMATEKAYAPYLFEATVGDRPAVEVKGMWDINGYFMAGPFINYIVEDKENNRLLIIEGFTFAPSTNKRDYMFELEAILKSLRFVNTA